MTWNVQDQWFAWLCTVQIISPTASKQQSDSVALSNHLHLLKGDNIAVQRPAKNDKEYICDPGQQVPRQQIQSHNSQVLTNPLLLGPIGQFSKPFRKTNRRLIKAIRHIRISPSCR